MIENPNFPQDSIKTRKIAFLIADGFDDAALAEMKQALMTAGAIAMTVAPRLGTITGAEGNGVKADFSFLTGSSVLFDAVYVPAGEASVSALQLVSEAATFLQEAFKHCKTIAASGEAVELLESAGIATGQDDNANRQLEVQAGVLVNRGADVGPLSAEFIKAIARHRHWQREAYL
jgi:catalase